MAEAKGLFDRHSDKIPTSNFVVDNKHMDNIFTEFSYSWYTFKPYAFLLLGIAFAFFLIRKLKDRFADD